MPRSITSRLTAAERQALLHCDPKTGLITASNFDLREGLQGKGYARRKSGGRFMYLTEYGWRLHARLKEEHKPFSVEGVPWPKIEEITDLYLLGMGIGEISRITRVTDDDILAVLDFRKVLPGA